MSKVLNHNCKNTSYQIIIFSINTFLLVSFLFFLVRLSPGDPTDKYISAKLGTELSEKIADKFSLNQPVN